MDLTDGTANIALAGEADGLDIDWCDWATEERLLCVVFGSGGDVNDPLPFARLIAVDWDGARRARYR